MGNGEGILLGIKDRRRTSKKLFTCPTQQLNEKMALILAAGLVLARQQAGLWQFLLLQANYGVYHWSPPKTTLNNGEQFMAGVYRALNENTGFAKEDVKLLDFSHKVTYPVNDGKDTKEVTYTLGKYVGKSDSVKLHAKHQAFKWAPFSEARVLVGYENMKQLLDKAHAELQKSKK